MYKNFTKALIWNSTTAFAYKAILLVHQIMLYAIIPKTVYGIQSTLFASIYALISFTNFGFEDTLIPFFSIYSQSKQHFAQMLYYFILRVIAVAILSTIFYKTLVFAPIDLIENIRFYSDPIILLLIALIFFIESIKKTLSSITQLAFLNKQISIAELSMLISYITIIWSYYYFTGKITLYTIFMPMFITATLELIYLTVVITMYYQQIPSIITTTNKIPFRLFLMQRIYNWIHQITKTIFSPNIMTIMFAYTLGFQQAATIKFFTTLITFGYTCIHKTIGISSGAILSATNHKSIEKIRFLFTQVTRSYFYFLYTMSTIIFVIVRYSYWANLITATMALHIVIFFIIGFLEQITLTYEQLFISQKKSKDLAILNIIELIIFFLIFYWSNYLQASVIFIFFVIIKLINLGAITYLADKYWAINLKAFQNK